MTRSAATKQGADATTRKRAPRWTETEVRRLLAEAGGSGLSVAEYARREGISEKRLYSWRSRLAARQASEVGARVDGSCKPRTPAFVPAVIVDRSGRAVGSAPVADAVTGVEVVLRSGHRLRIGADFDAATLVRLVEALDGPPC